MSESASNGLLFDVAPLEDAKKKPSKRRKQVTAANPAISHQIVEDLPASGYLASIEGHYKCDQCGVSVLDLVDTRKVDGRTMWLVTCGWWCLHSWLVEPIPGLLDKADEERKAKGDFTVRGGRFDGQTFDQISQDGNRWYIEQLVKKGKRSFLAAAAAEWLAKNS